MVSSEPFRQLMYTLKHWAKSGKGISWAYIVLHNGDKFQEPFDHYYTATHTANTVTRTMSRWLKSQHGRNINSRKSSDIKIQELVKETTTTGK
jgi:hypothetical protein